MAIICFVISDFIRQCSFEIHNIGNFLIIYIRHKSPLTPCDIMVASAAPDTPSLKTIINVRSSIIFKILEKTRNKNGVLLSPTALSSPDKKLYKIVKGIPKNIIKRYEYASSKIFSGVESICNMFGQRMAQAVVITAAKSIERKPAWKMASFIFSVFLAQKCCETGIAKPQHIPMQKPSTRNCTLDEAPTLASFSSPRYCPTIAVSIIL